MGSERDSLHHKSTVHLGKRLMVNQGQGTFKRVSLPFTKLNKQLQIELKLQKTITHSKNSSENVFSPSDSTEDSTFPLDKCSPVWVLEVLGPIGVPRSNIMIYPSMNFLIPDIVGILLRHFHQREENMLQQGNNGPGHTTDSFHIMYLPKGWFIWSRSHSNFLVGAKLLTINPILKKLGSLFQPSHFQGPVKPNRNIVSINAPTGLVLSLLVIHDQKTTSHVYSLD